MTWWPLTCSASFSMVIFSSTCLWAWVWTACLSCSSILSCSCFFSSSISLILRESASSLSFLWSSVIFCILDFAFDNSLCWKKKHTVAIIAKYIVTIHYMLKYQNIKTLKNDQGVKGCPQTPGTLIPKEQYPYLLLMWWNMTKQSTTNFKTKQHSVKRDINTPKYQYLLNLQFDCSGFLKILHI